MYLIKNKLQEIILPLTQKLCIHPQDMEVPRLGVDLELQLLAYTTGYGNIRSLTH